MDEGRPAAGRWSWLRAEWRKRLEPGEQAAVLVWTAFARPTGIAISTLIA